MMDREQLRRVRTDRIAAIVFYGAAYFYTYYCLLNFEERLFGFEAGCAIFSVIFVAFVEGYSAAAGRTLSSVEPSLRREGLCLALLTLLQGFAIFLHGLHGEDFGVMQVLLWHFTAIYYVLARTGMLTAGGTGVWFAWDACVGALGLPFAHFFLRILCVFRRTGKKDAPEMSSEEREKAFDEKFRRISVLVLTLFFACTAGTIAWRELAQVSGAFAAIGEGFFGALRDFFSLRFLWERIGEWLPFILFSLPVGAYLFGLIGGGLKRQEPMVSRESLEEAVSSVRIFPPYTGFVVMGTLIAIYTLFFGVQSAELVRTLTGSGAGASLRELVSVHEASVFAVKGFWQLFRVVLLNFAVLLASLLLMRKPLWEDRRSRIVLDVFFAFGVAFALLAGFKLVVLYFGLYGPTPRRILSTWMLGMELLWCVLAIIRFHRRYPAVKWGVYAGAVSFCALALLDIEGICGL